MKRADAGSSSMEESLRASWNGWGAADCEDVVLTVHRRLSFEHQACSSVLCPGNDYVCPASQLSFLNVL